MVKFDDEIRNYSNGEIQVDIASTHIVSGCYYKQATGNKKVL